MATLDLSTIASGTPGAPGSPGRRFTGLTGVRWNPKRLVNGPALAVLLALIIVVELIALGPARLPTATGVITVLPETLGDLAFWRVTAATMWSVVLGMAAGVAAGLVMGLFVGRFRWLRAALNPYISGLNAMPMLALVPLVTIWLGYSSEARTAMVFLSAALPVTISVSDGAQKVPVNLEEVMEVLRVGRLRRIKDLVLPSTVPYIVAGANVAIGRGVIAAVSVEFMASVAGLGTFILTNSRSFNQNEAFLGILVIAVGGLLLRAAVQKLSEIAFPWYRTARGTK